MKLKKITLLAGILLVGCNAFSQVDSTDRYKLQFFLPDSGTVYYSCVNDWVIGGDTIINGKRMKKYYSGDYYYGAVREDTSTAKYYAVYKDSEEETLLVDFSVEKGDFITDSVIVGIPPRKLSGLYPQAIDVYLDRYGRKNVLVEYTTLHLWVEGIGCVDDAAFNPLYGIADYRLDMVLQIKSNDSVIYEHEFYGEHDLCETGILGEKTKTEVNVYPNPASSYLIIDLDQIDCLSYEIITQTGTVCQTSDLNYCIDISNVPVGINYLIIKDEKDKAMSFSKFIKK